MRLSVVIPALNERAGLPETLAHLAGVLTADEVIVADGGSEDGTREWVRAQAGVRLVEAPRGRGPQMNAGAGAATGDVLLFLHADCTLPAGAWEAIRSALTDPSVVGGAFGVRFPPDCPAALHVTARVITLRSRAFREATGDQAIFVRRSTFTEAGGFPPWPLFEDFALVGRLKKLGRFRLLRRSVTISPRRWQAFGVGRTNALMCLLYVGYRLGVPPARLKGWFADVRPAPSQAGAPTATPASPGPGTLGPGRT